MQHPRQKQLHWHTWCFTLRQQGSQNTLRVIGRFNHLASSGNSLYSTSAPQEWLENNSDIPTSTLTDMMVCSTDSQVRMQRHKCTCMLPCLNNTPTLSCTPIADRLWCLIYSHKVHHQVDLLNAYAVAVKLRTRSCSCCRKAAEILHHA